MVFGRYFVGKEIVKSGGWKLMASTILSANG